VARIHPGRNDRGYLPVSLSLLPGLVGVLALSCQCLGLLFPASLRWSAFCVLALYSGVLDRCAYSPSPLGVPTHTLAALVAFVENSTHTAHLALHLHPPAHTCLPYSHLLPPYATTSLSFLCPLLALILWRHAYCSGMCLLRVGLHPFPWAPMPPCLEQTVCMSFSGRRVEVLCHLWDGKSESLHCMPSPSFCCLGSYLADLPACGVNTLLLPSLQVCCVLLHYSPTPLPSREGGSASTLLSLGLLRRLGTLEEERGGRPFLRVCSTGSPACCASFSSMPLFSSLSSLLYLPSVPSLLPCTNNAGLAFTAVLLYTLPTISPSPLFCTGLPTF